MKMQESQKDDQGRNPKLQKVNQQHPASGILMKKNPHHHSAGPMEIESNEGATYQGGSQKVKFEAGHSRN